MKVIHLTTTKVIGNKINGMPIFERKTVKLEDGKVFNSFVAGLVMNGYHLEDGEEPKVVKVLETAVNIKKEKDNLDQIKEDAVVVSKEINEKEKYQAIVDKSLAPVKKEGKVDVVGLQNENEELKKRLDDIDAKFAALNAGEIVEDVDSELDELKAKAKDLGIKGYGVMKEETLKAKIAEIENK